jgi:hypothetical protein
VEWKPVLLLAGYLLLAPPAFVLGPLTGLLLLSRPRTVREWVWIAVAAGASLLWLRQPGNLAGQVVRAAAVLLTGAYVALTMWRPAPGWTRAALATLLGGGELALLMAWAKIDAVELQRTAAHGFRMIERVVPSEYRTQAPMLAEQLGALFPVLLAVIGMAGVQLAWTWHCRLAERPVGKRFCTGEFNL